MHIPFNSTQVLIALVLVQISTELSQTKWGAGKPRNEIKQEKRNQKTHLINPNMRLIHLHVLLCIAPV